MQKVLFKGENISCINLKFFLLAFFPICTALLHENFPLAKSDSGALKFYKGPSI